jgi:hypothetical protein
VGEKFDFSSSIFGELDFEGSGPSVFSWKSSGGFVSKRKDGRDERSSLCADEADGMRGECSWVGGSA